MSCENELVIAEEGPEENPIRVTFKCKRPKDHPGVHSHSGETDDGVSFGTTWSRL